MSAPPRSSRGNHRAGQELFTHIQLGMDVEDASGEPIGNVIYLGLAIHPPSTEVWRTPR